jgi:hypothetical protein
VEPAGRLASVGSVRSTKASSEGWRLRLCPNRHERSPLTNGQSLENTESMNNVFSHKLNYLLVCHVFQSNDLSPFGEVVCGN